ncbi:transcription factor kayak isoform X3 [Microplitis mediator]|uniref:transcription factor kayak isoform X3 n=1 Tax=Microplitis mediator TaxID=375433 RepID=UPI002555B122|nr:transcription factor kayak isoform X3 [Microplitis mediator]XP_057337894.1 transcription factor kayak isoform X3 [Microplitis mediator]
MKLDVSDVMYDNSSVSSDSGTSESSHASHDFLSNITNATIPNSLASLDGLHSGVPTRTTPTLTPTTLRSIEQTFLELTNEPASHSREAGFVPPLVEPSQPTPAQTQNNSVITGQNHNHNHHHHHSVLLENQQTRPQQQARRNMGGRRPTRTIGISPEEEERRQVRRERNKMAAARCRKRRMDHTNALLEETEGLEKKKQTLQNEITQLQQAKDDLEFLLETHRAVCRLRSSSPPDVKPLIKSEITIDSSPFLHPNKCESIDTRPNRPNSLPVGFENNNRPNSLPIFAANETKDRPDSLQFKTVETPSFMKTSNEVAGVPITTPSSGIPFNFDSLMDGGTGLTPVSTPLIPSCSTQQRHNLSAVDLSSPDANPPKLVSL